MDDRPDATSAAPDQLIVTGLGPGDLDRLPTAHLSLLTDPGRRVIVRTLHHPAAAQLAEMRPVVTCDDLYQAGDSFEEVYSAIVDRVLALAREGPTIYAVPGSPLVGEFAVRQLLKREPRAEVVPSESFVDAVLAAVGCDPFAAGLRIINGHELPDPLALDCPTIIGHLDAPAVLAEVGASLSRALPEGAGVTLCVGLGSSDEQVLEVEVDRIPAALAGLRTSLFVDAQPAGLYGLIGVSRRLRRECPWDAQQTHTSLVPHLLEEAYELAEAIAALPEPDTEPDYVAYDGLEEELGDVLLQVLFHANIAAEKGAFGIDDVAARLTAKLVHRHPHVFGDVTVVGADEVASNWEKIKADEKPSGSLMDGVPQGMPALERAMKLQGRAATVGFDWDEPAQVIEVLGEELSELDRAVEGDGDVAHELGDVLFTVVNLARHLDIDPEVALRRAVGRFQRRFRAMEEMGPVAGLSPDQLEERWRAAKADLG